MIIRVHPTPFCARDTWLTVSVAVFLATAVSVIRRWRSVSAERGRCCAGSSDTYKNVYDGWKWWHVYCYRCHGVDAIGTTQRSKPDRSEPKSSRLAEFLKIVRDGIPDKGMQAWDKLLDHKQINQIHLYVRARTDKVLAARSARRSRARTRVRGRPQPDGLAVKRNSSSSVLYIFHLHEPASVSARPCWTSSVLM